MAEWDEKRKEGELDDDHECRFCKPTKHAVDKCPKLREYREKLKKYKLVDVVAIIVDQQKELPYFTLDVQGTKSIQTVSCMIDSGAEMSVLHYDLCKRLGLALEKTNMNIQGAGGGKTTIDFVTLVPILINSKVYKIPALVSKSDYFKDKTILGKQFFAEADVSVRVGDDGIWILVQHTPRGEIILSKPRSPGVKKIHLISQETRHCYYDDDATDIEDQAFQNYRSFNLHNITLNPNTLHKQAKNNPIPDLVEDRSWEFHGQSDAYDIAVDESQLPKWVYVHSLEASEVFTKVWLEQRIAESTYAEQNATYSGMEANIKLKPDSKGLLKSSKPIVQSPELIEIMKYHLKKMIRLGQIEEVKKVTGNSCPAFLVKKPGKADYSDPGAWRLVVNLKDVNQHTIRDCYPLPLIKTIFQDIAAWGDSVFAKMDMTNGFSQMPLAEEDRWVTTFNTPHGLYRYRVLPMGACNSPATFQRENDRILADVQAQGKCLHVKIYIDDIFVGGKTLQDLLRNVEEDIELFLRHGRTMNYKKSEFGLTKAAFLGFTLSADGGVSVDEDVFETVSRKLNDILASTMLENDTKKKAQSILGTLNYFREFIYNYAHKVEFINAFLRKASTTHWTEKEDDKIEELIIELQNSGRILPINPHQELVVQCDASGFGIAYIALQINDENQYVICDMNSASLTKGQRDYCASYREAVALAFAVKHLLHKIQATKIHAYTDNSALIHIFGKTVEKRPILKISEFLDQQGIKLTHIKGSENGGSDSLSRIHTAFINSGWLLIPDAELSSYSPIPSINKPFLLQSRIPVIAELILLLFSGGKPIV